MRSLFLCTARAAITSAAASMPPWSSNETKKFRASSSREVASANNSVFLSGPRTVCSHLSLRTSIAFRHAGRSQCQDRSVPNDAVVGVDILRHKFHRGIAAGEKQAGEALRDHLNIIVARERL